MKRARVGESFRPQLKIVTLIHVMEVATHLYIIMEDLMGTGNFEKIKTITNVEICSQHIVNKITFFLYQKGKIAKYELHQHTKVQLNKQLSKG